MAAGSAGAKKPKRLGRGLSSLIGETASALASQPVEVSPEASKKAGGDVPRGTSTVDPENSESGVRLTQIPVDRIIPNKYQPRREFDDVQLAGLAASIKAEGVMQPVVARPSGGGSFELVAGERRWRAAGLAGLETIPAVVVELDERKAAEWSVVENVQREQLNPMERAWAYRRLVDDFEMSHGAVAASVGLDRVTVSNTIRLTELEESIQELLMGGALQMGHGRALLAFPAGAAREKTADRCASEGWSVRKLERAAKEPGAAEKKSGGAPTRGELARTDLEKKLGESLGTKVEVKTTGKGSSGRVVVHFYDLDQLDGLIARMSGG